MNVWVITSMWNSRKLLPYFLRNYDGFCDKIIIYDFMSDDGSIEIAKADPKVELRQTGIEYTIDSLISTINCNTLYKEARGQADWVILPTTDEFLYCKIGMKCVLQNCLDRGVTLPAIIGYNMFHDELPNTDGQLWEKYKLGVAHAMYNKPILFNPMLEMNFDHGKHSANPIGNVVRDDTFHIKLLHYRYWGFDDLVELHLSRWNRSSRGNREAGFGGYDPKGNGFHSIPWWEEQKLLRAEVI